VDKVLKQIGRNILVFQQIEKSLKIIIPFISHPTAPQKDIDDIRKQTESVKLQTLGSLVNSFLKSTFYDVNDFAESLKNIVDERNQLVHHFGDKPGLNVLNTEEGCKNCLARLEAQYQEAISFYKTIELVLFSYLVLLRKSYGEYHQELERLYQHSRQYIISSGVEYVNLTDPSDTVWENTKIVKLLQLAELRIEKTDDMTSLARAGEFIKKIDLECIPKRYGIKTLKGILNVSGLFEVREMQNSQQSIILYKSKT
jgi:hypothetical protein